MNHNDIKIIFQNWNCVGGREWVLAISDVGLDGQSQHGSRVELRHCERESPLSLIVQGVFALNRPNVVLDVGVHRQVLTIRSLDLHLHFHFVSDRGCIFVKVSSNKKLRLRIGSNPELAD